MPCLAFGADRSKQQVRFSSPQQRSKPFCERLSCLIVFRGERLGTVQTDSEQTATASSFLAKSLICHLNGIRILAFLRFLLCLSNEQPNVIYSLRRWFHIRKWARRYLRRILEETAGGGGSIYTSLIARRTGRIFQLKPSYERRAIEEPVVPDQQNPGKILSFLGKGYWMRLLGMED
jgi:hypothetical protein